MDDSDHHPRTSLHPHLTPRFLPSAPSPFQLDQHQHHRDSHSRDWSPVPPQHSEMEGEEYSAQPSPASSSFYSGEQLATTLLAMAASSVSPAPSSTLTSSYSHQPTIIYPYQRPQPTFSPSYYPSYTSPHPLDDGSTVEDQRQQQHLHHAQDAYTPRHLPSPPAAFTHTFDPRPPTYYTQANYSHSSSYPLEPTTTSSFAGHSHAQSLAFAPPPLLPPPQPQRPSWVASPAPQYTYYPSPMTRQPQYSEPSSSSSSGWSYSSSDRPSFVSSLEHPRPSLSHRPRTWTVSSDTSNSSASSSSTYTGGGAGGGPSPSTQASSLPASPWERDVSILPPMMDHHHHHHQHHQPWSTPYSPHANEHMFVGAAQMPLSPAFPPAPVGSEMVEDVDADGEQFEEMEMELTREEEKSRWAGELLGDMARGVGGRGGGGSGTVGLGITFDDDDEATEELGSTRDEEILEQQYSEEHVVPASLGFQQLQPSPSRSSQSTSLLSSLAESTGNTNTPIVRPVPQQSSSTSPTSFFGDYQSTTDVLNLKGKAIDFSPSLMPPSFVYSTSLASWVCYRRNYLTCTVTLPLSAFSSSPIYLPSNSRRPGPTHRITSFEVSLLSYSHPTGDPSPLLAFDVSRKLASAVPLEPITISLPSTSSSDGKVRTEARLAKFVRVQYRNSTANHPAGTGVGVNGITAKVRMRVLIEAVDEKGRKVEVGRWESGELVVRGRSPKNFVRRDGGEGAAKGKGKKKKVVRKVKKEEEQEERWYSSSSDDEDGEEEVTTGGGGTRTRAGKGSTSTTIASTSTSTDASARIGLEDFDIETLSIGQRTRRARTIKRE